MGGVVLFPNRGGCIPSKAWFYPLKGVVLRVVLSPIWGWFHARDHLIMRCLVMTTIFMWCNKVVLAFQVIADLQRFAPWKVF